jgi:Ca-activated chloride channel family protein
MSKINLAIIGAGMALAAFFLPDAAFRRPVPEADLGEVRPPAEAAESAEGYISAVAELSQSMVANDGATPVSLRLRLKAPVAEGRVRPPTDVVVVVDRSGSMSAEKRIEFARRGLVEAAMQLRPEDRLGIVTFAGDVTVVRELASVEESRRELESLVRGIQPGGGTYLSGGLDAAACLLENSGGQGRARQILLLSDGHANIGVQGERLAELGRTLGQCGIIVTAMGVGSDYDAQTFIRLGEGSGGGYAYVTRGDRIPVAIRGELARANQRLIDNMRIMIEPAPGVRVLTAYKHAIRQHGSRVEILAPVLAAGEERSIIVDLVVQPDAARRVADGRLTPARVMVRYSRPDYGEGAGEETLSLNPSLHATSDPRLADASMNLDVMAERDALRADLAWAATANQVATGQYDVAATRLREEARTLAVANRRYQSPTVAARIQSMIEAATRIESRSFFGGSAAGEATMGQNQAALSAGVY